ncbi:MAG: hypothetical protein LBC13_02255 [Clostridiales bacterium]|jgi:predicted Fe-Mo cluster-binding NifX family protein|nr:hypothetical protein [Clostridiales bacterium]
MKYYAAVATDDGKIVNLHFGRCGKFLTAEIDTDTNEISVLGATTVRPACLAEHEEDAFDEIAALLSDCKFIIAARAGLAAKRYMKAKGLIILEDSQLVDDALKTLLFHLRATEKGL